MAMTAEMNVPETTCEMKGYCYIIAPMSTMPAATTASAEAPTTPARAALFVGVTLAVPLTTIVNVVAVPFPMAVQAAYPLPSAQSSFIVSGSTPSVGISNIWASVEPSTRVTVGPPCLLAQAHSNPANTAGQSK